MQELKSEDAIYALPSLTLQGGYETTDDVVCGAAALNAMDSGNGLEDDTAFDSLTNERISDAQCPLHLFKVVHLSPGRMKGVKNCFYNLRNDHVALAPYLIDARMLTDADGPMDLSNLCLMVSSALSHDSDATSKFLSLKTLMKMDVQTLASQFLECKIKTTALQYHLEGWPIPHTVSRATVTQILTALVNAEALPGPWSTCFMRLGEDAQLKVALEFLERDEIVFWVVARRGFRSLGDFH